MPLKRFTDIMKPQADAFAQSKGDLLLDNNRILDDPDISLPYHLVQYKYGENGEDDKPYIDPYGNLSSNPYFTIRSGSIVKVGDIINVISLIPGVVIRYSNKPSVTEESNIFPYNGIYVKESDIGFTIQLYIKSFLNHSMSNLVYGEFIVN